MKIVEDLKVKLFADGADRLSMLNMYNQPHVKGLTTNPTLMKKAGITDYGLFCKDILKTIVDKPISFEVFSDDFAEMEEQALEIASWGTNVYVKIPITNTKSEPCYQTVKNLVEQDVKVNITAIMTIKQISEVANILDPTVPSYVSIFAGRIADTGRDPVSFIAESLKILESIRNAEIIWASTRELYNIIQADMLGCHIITVTHDLLKKLHLLGFDLNEYSLDTVKMFYADAQAAGYKLELEAYS